MYIPEDFYKKIIGAFGEDGKKWLETLEDKVEIYIRKWNLVNEGAVPNLSYNYVLKVRNQQGVPYILKLGVPNFDFRNEIQTIKSYAGVGCAALINADPDEGVMLLEQLVPGKMLSDIEDEELVLDQYIKVWQSIRRPLLTNENVPLISNWASALKKYQEKHQRDDGPIPNSFISYAYDCFEEIFNSSIGPELLHGDLHHENILYSDTRGWLAIDPKGVGGDTYFDFTSFLFNHLFSKADPAGLLEYRVNTLCTRLDLNRERFLKAAVAMATLSACWSIEDHDPFWEETYQCAKWFVKFISQKGI